jgi:hypothetical protein
VLARLPQRNTIEEDLQRSWEGIAEGAQVIQTRLHYLDKLIEIDLILPVSMCVPEHATGIRKLQEGANSLDYVGKVNIYYVN